MGNHVFDAISAAARPNAPFIETVDGKRWSYGDMVEKSAQIAGALVALGVRPGDRVVAQTEKSPEALMLYIGCLRAGAVYLPLNTSYTITELEYFVSDAEPRLIVAAPDVADNVRSVSGRYGARVETLDASGAGSLIDLAERQPPSFLDAHRGPDDLAAILYTSGTTGRSKGAMLTHDNLLSNALTLRECWRFSSADRLIHALPIFHSHGLFVASNVVMLSGASMIFLPKFDIDEVLRLLPQASVLMGVPTFYVRLAQHPALTRELVDGMRLFVSGSAPLNAETHDLFRERTGHAILERYGMTETNMNTSNPYDGDRIAGTVGFPLPGVELIVVDPETETPVPNGETGMIQVRGPNVFKGYWRMPEKTEAEFRPGGFFITGDLGKIDARGYVHIVGRSKDLIISGGYNIYPKEIETAIDALEAVVESAVIGIPHPDLGECVVAVVVPMSGMKLDERAVLDGIGGQLARFKQPRAIVFVNELPRNAMGKVQKNVLREQYSKVL